ALLDGCRDSGRGFRFPTSAAPNNRIAQVHQADRAIVIHPAGLWRATDGAFFCIAAHQKSLKSFMERPLIAAPTCRRHEFFNVLPTWKSATQQAWKPALQRIG